MGAGGAGGLHWEGCCNQDTKNKSVGSQLKGSKAEKEPDMIQEPIVVMSEKKSDILPASI